MKRLRLMLIMICFAFIGIILIVACKQNSPNQVESGHDQIKVILPELGVFQFGQHEAFIQMPNDYNPNTTYPIILFFHGRGGNANWFLRAKKGDLNLFLSKTRQRGYIFVAPDYGSDSWMNAHAENLTLELLDFLNKNLSLNPKRLYVMGGSMGGGATLTFAARHAEKVSAACDIFGVTDFIRFYNDGNYNQSIASAFGGSPEQCPEVYRQRSAVYNIDSLKTVPLLIIHGDKDTTVPLWNSQILYDKLKSTNALVELIIVPDIAHTYKILSGQEDIILDFFETEKVK